MAYLCDGDGHLTCYCQGDHCGCGMEAMDLCAGCDSCVEPADLDLESLAVFEPSIERRPMERVTLPPRLVIGEIEERRGRYGD